MTDIQRYEPWPQEWPIEDANGDLVLYEDHVKVVGELVEALKEARIHIAGSAPDWHYRTREILAVVDTAIAKIKETTK